MSDESLANVYADLLTLRHWGIDVLKNSSSNMEDLKEVVAIRARAEEKIRVLIEEGKTAVFFEALKTDQLCSSYVYSLLRLTREEAIEAASRYGGHLNPVSWYGVHDWEVYKVLPLWMAQINEHMRMTTPADLSEVLWAHDQISTRMGREWVNENLQERNGYKEELSQEVVIRLKRAIRTHRTSLEDSR